MFRGFSALSHPARVKILQHLSGFDACCCKDVVHHLDLAQSTVSQHLKVLVEAGLVHVRPERQSSRYEVNTVALKALSSSLAGLVHTCVDAKEKKQMRQEAETDEQ
ncbi:metalloregulator ArsR/SmtB family transcription factor [Nitratireductor sp. GISD-1A_MAKvit]|uniref:ArsR/SmtB family transcription factor n=1 Tax=Nitratireductor sp. GISD-1A_MAKvit TaxID=3234198 RepID=UPI0034661FD8